MPRRIMRIGFAEEEVAIISRVDGASEAIARDFELMLRPEGPFERHQMEIAEQEGQFLLKRGKTKDYLLPSLSQVAHYVSRETLRNFMQARNDLAWFHAGAAAMGGRAIVVAGRQGRGKSTIITGLCRQGWMYLSDEVVPIDPVADAAVPYPVTAHPRIHSGAEWAGERLPEVPKERVRMAPEQACRAAAPIGAIVFPRYSRSEPGRLEPRRPASAAVELLENSMGLAPRDAKMVNYVCGLAQRVPAFDLVYGSPEEAIELARKGAAPWLAAGPSAPTQDPRAAAADKEQPRCL